MNKKVAWKQQLDQSRANLESVLDQLSSEQWQTPVFSEGQTWTVRDVVAHLVENERGMSIHIHKIRKGRETVPENFDLQEWNAGLKSRAGDVQPGELRKQLVEVRQRTLQEMETLSPAEWELTGRHPFRGVITIEQYYETMADHEATHTQDIKTALKMA